MKGNRHTKILELIKMYPITTQEELLSRLREEGLSVTQSTVSRDIKTLRLQKSHSADGSYRYIAPIGTTPDIKNGFEGILTSSIVSVATAQNLVVVKTYAGMASAACAAIDNMSLSDVVGSLAGDDTIFIACKDNFAATELMQGLNKYSD